MQTSRLPISRTFLATVAGIGCAFAFMIAAILVRWQFLLFDKEGYLYAAPVLYKTAYVLVLAVALYALLTAHSAIFRAAAFAACAILVVLLQYRRFGLPLYALWPQLVVAVLNTLALLVGWRLLRYVGLYYRGLWHRSFPKP